jgi:hypothetical protein
VRAHGVHRLTDAVPASVATWLGYVAADFIMHAVVLGPWWRSTATYWLPAGDLAKRIPLAYGAFALASLAIVRLLMRFTGPRPFAGHALRFGLLAGAIFGLVVTLTTFSVFAMPLSALLAWPASTSVAVGGAAVAGASVLRASRPWRQVLKVLLTTVVLSLAGVLVQSL